MVVIVHEWLKSFAPHSLVAAANRTMWYLCGVWLIMWPFVFLPVCETFSSTSVMTKAAGWESSRTTSHRGQCWNWCSSISTAMTSLQQHEVWLCTQPEYCASVWSCKPSYQEAGCCHQHWMGHPKQTNACLFSLQQMSAEKQPHWPSLGRHSWVNPTYFSRSSDTQHAVQVTAPLARPRNYSAQHQLTPTRHPGWRQTEGPLMTLYPKYSHQMVIVA